MTGSLTCSPADEPDCGVPSQGGTSGEAPQCDMRHGSVPMDEESGRHGSGDDNEENKSAPQCT